MGGTARSNFIMLLISAALRDQESQRSSAVDNSAGTCMTVQEGSAHTGGYAASSS